MKSPAQQKDEAPAMTLDEQTAHTRVTLNDAIQQLTNSMRQIQGALAKERDATPVDITKRTTA